MPKKMLDDIQSMVLNVYQPNFRFIKSITPNYPITTGTFDIPPKQYTTHDTIGLSGASSIILIMQASIIAVADNLHNKRISELENFSLDTIQEIENFCRKALVCNYNNIKFKKLILKNNPECFFEINF